MYEQVFLSLHHYDVNYIFLQCPPHSSTANDAINVFITFTSNIPLMTIYYDDPIYVRNCISRQYKLTVEIVLSFALMSIKVPCARNMLFESFVIYFIK